VQRDLYLKLAEAVSERLLEPLNRKEERFSLPSLSCPPGEENGEKARKLAASQ